MTLNLSRRISAILSVALFLFAISDLRAGERVEFSADLVILGETHDNPAHHARQAQILRDLQPKAVVYEMLTPQEASQLAGVPQMAKAIRQATTGFHWGNIGDYADVLVNSEVILGAALPREVVRTAFKDGAANTFGDKAELFGLTQALDPSELAERMQIQFEAHCEAMPLEMMGGMVEAQRLRDAHFARVLLDAARSYGTPVVLITGNGHARTDWGVPRFLARVRPDLSVVSIGQSEGGVAFGAFDQVLDADPVDRDDPCAAFR